MKIYGVADVIKKFGHGLEAGKYLQRIFAVALGCGALMLSGCSAVQDAVVKKAGIMTDEDYEKYIELRETGQLDQNGYYVQEGIAIEAETADDGQMPPLRDGIHVTFAKNAYLEINYFSDADMSNPIDGQVCYLQPGDCIYASEPVCVHPANNWYRFDRFCVYAYDSSGHRGEELFWQEEESGGRLALRVPADYDGAEVSVEPLGKYEKHSVALTDYYIDSTGQKQEASGKWIINDEETAGRVFEASPVETLVVDYRYDPEEYCYVSSVPDSFYHENGLVRFETISADSNIEEYSVELRPIEGEFSFDPSNYSVEHGSVIFKYKNHVIKEKRGIPDGDTIDYVAEPDFGYQHPKGAGQIIVDASNPDQTDAEIREATRFYVDELVDVILPQANGGVIEYVANGEILTGETCALRCGTVITMNFFGWNGWICSQADGIEYTVTEQRVNQSVTIQGEDINSTVFRESDQHKPILNIVVEDSMKEAIFEVSASDTHEEKLGYGTGNKTTILPDWMGQNDRVIFENKIGTDKDITLGITNDTILEGDALKLKIAIIDANDNKDESVQYITKLPAESKIVLYDEKEIADSATVFKEIIVTASRVKAVLYEPKLYDNATVQVFLDGRALEKGDVLEESRNVKVTVTPSNGYAVTGSKTDNGIYSDAMKYSKWEKDWEKIMEDHPIKKLWHVTLDTADEYGDCIFLLEGEEVSGTVEVYEGQKLVIEYTITDPGYQIDRSGIDNLIGGIIHKNTKKETVIVTEEMDGKVIRRSDYVTVKPKGDK